MTWDERVAAFWDRADDAHPQEVLDDMRILVEERDRDDPEAMFEWASVHDFLGREREAIPLYRKALDLGLSGDRLPQAIIQLASSLRNIGEAAAAVELLQNAPKSGITGDARQAFLALALHDCGHHDASLRVALEALAPTLPMYGRAVSRYAAELTESLHED
jgi:hypothetical protein